MAPIGETGPARDLGKFSKQVLPTVSSFPDFGMLSSRRPAKSAWNDPWPELPEDQPVSIANWMEVLRNWERLRALDFEQRGGG